MRSAALLVPEATEACMHGPRMCKQHNLIHTTDRVTITTAVVASLPYTSRHQFAVRTRSQQERRWAGRALIMDGSRRAARRNCATALGRSLTGNSHQVSHEGVSGSARNVGTCRWQSKSS